VRLKISLLFFTAVILVAPTARADYIVLRSGQRLSVSSYQLVGDTYRVQLAGGSAEIPASQVVGIEPEEIFTASAPDATSVRPAIEYAELIRSASKQYGVDANLIVSVIAVESNFNPNAVSRRNARGLMQLLPQTATRLGVHNIFDPAQNINAGTRYLKGLLARYDNNLALALAAYNAGPQNVQRYGRVPPFSETVSYVRRIQKEYARRQSTRASNGASARETGSL
jgi:soluble lytic murein transglycosylase-like protein